MAKDDCSYCIQRTHTHTHTRIDKMSHSMLLATSTEQVISLNHLRGHRKARWGDNCCAERQKVKDCRQRTIEREAEMNRRRKEREDERLE